MSGTDARACTARRAVTLAPKTDEVSPDRPTFNHDQPAWSAYITTQAHVTVRDAHRRVRTRWVALACIHRGCRPSDGACDRTND